MLEYLGKGKVCSQVYIILFLLSSGGGTLEFECKDLEPSSSCQYWKSEGYCDGSEFQVWVLEHCPKTCGVSHCTNVAFSNLEAPASDSTIPKAIVLLILLGIFALNFIF